MRWNIWVAAHLYTLWNKKCAVWLFLDVSFRVIKQKCIFNFAADHLSITTTDYFASCQLPRKTGGKHAAQALNPAKLLLPWRGIFRTCCLSERSDFVKSVNHWWTHRIVRIHHVVWLMKYYWFCLLFLPFSYLQYWLLGCFTHWSCYVAAWSRRWKDKHTTTVQSISLLV